MENKAKRGRPRKTTEVIDVEVSQPEVKSTGIEIRRAPTAILQFHESAERLISQAIDKSVPVETMEKLLAMRRELRAEAAKEEYNRAMAELQAVLPIITKTAKGGETKGGEVAYKYAKIDKIDEVTREPIAQHGFSYTFRQVNDGNRVKVTCVVSHIGGHVDDSSTMETGLSTKTGVMSGPQQIAATVSFNKRYAFCNAFGITTGDEDVDAAKNVVEPPQNVPQAPKAPQKPEVQPRINKLQADEINGLIKALKIEKENAKREMEIIVEGEIKDFKLLTAKEADLIITEFKARLAKIQKAWDGKDPEAPANAPQSGEKPKENLATRAMNCKTQEEASNIMGEAALTKDVTEIKKLALKNILNSKGFKV